MQPADVVTVVYAELLKVAGGATLIIAALSAFISKIWIDRITKAEGLKRDRELLELRMELERASAELKSARDIASQRHVLVDKVQFEHEYSIYRDAWSKLYALRQTTLRLRSIVQQRPLSELSPEDVQVKVLEFMEPYRAFQNVVAINRPFYPQSVYATLGDVVSVCARELALAHLPASNPTSFWNEAGKSHKDINQAIEVACESIRSRISEVRVS